jgi:phthalate 4,5-cis-dihydrodiol dehydrogenase
VQSPEEEARLKNAGTYGGPAYRPPGSDEVEEPLRKHQHFGPVIVSCECGDLRPLPDGISVYGDAIREHRALAPPAVPRFEVIDELYAAMTAGQKPLHDGVWAKATLEVCLALLRSGREQRDVSLRYQVGSGG